MIKKGDITLVNLYLDNTCNLKCSYCYEENNIIGETTIKSLDEIVEYLDKILLNNKIHLDMCGREMSIAYPKYDYVLGKLKNIKNIKNLNTITNCYSISNGFLKFLKKYEPYSLMISIDLCKRVNDINRITRIGSKPTYDSILENVKKISSLDIKLTASSVYDPNNKPTYEEFSNHVDNLIKAGFKSYKIAFINDVIPDKIEDSIFIFDIVYKKIIDIHNTNNGKFVIRLSSGFDIGRIREYFNGNFKIDCNARRSVTLSPNSKKYSCMLALTDPKVFKHKYLFEIHNGLYGNEMIKEVTDKFTCMKCKVNIFCRGACPMLFLGDGINACIDKRKKHAELAAIYWYKLFSRDDAMVIINEICLFVDNPIFDKIEYRKIKSVVNGIVEECVLKEVDYGELIK